MHPRTLGTGGRKSETTLSLLESKSRPDMPYGRWVRMSGPSVKQTAVKVLSLQLQWQMGIALPFVPSAGTSDAAGVLYQSKPGGWPF